MLETQCLLLRNACQARLEYSQEPVQVYAAAGLFGMITKADRFGVSDSQFIRPIARYAVAVTNAPQERVAARPQDSRKELDLSH
jgi:hypothetical protein